MPAPRRKRPAKAAAVLRRIPYGGKRWQRSKKKKRPSLHSMQLDSVLMSNVLTIIRYRGYNRDLINRFCAMGFDVPVVVAAFEYVGIDRMDGQDYELEEAYMGDVTARLFGEA